MEEKTKIKTIIVEDNGSMWISSKPLPLTRDKQIGVLDCVSCLFQVQLVTNQAFIFPDENFNIYIIF